MINSYLFCCLCDVPGFIDTDVSDSFIKMYIGQIDKIDRDSFVSCPIAKKKKKTKLNFSGRIFFKKYYLISPREDFHNEV